MSTSSAMTAMATDSHTHQTHHEHHKPKPKLTFVSTSIGAMIESFYRSGMNNVINAKVMGEKGKYFPDMHIQIPIRVVYVNGLKQIRAVCDTTDTSEMKHPNLVRMLLSFVPGCVMSPFSSALEAANAGKRNPESMAIRWIRGFYPRLAREVIFGIGINQMADFFTKEYAPRATNNPHLQGALGSISAGIVAGYFSHIPHNLSTMKLFYPNKSYGVLWKEFYMRSMFMVPSWIPWKNTAAQFMCVVFPIGVVRRSIQIGGTFIIINGTIFACRNKPWP